MESKCFLHLNLAFRWLAALAKILETGLDVTGQPAVWPLFRFSYDDAIAVVA
jgi:hypothetical protein